MKPRWWIVLISILALTGLFFIPQVPRWIAWIYTGMSVITFAVYGWDKRKSAQAGWRTKEATLHGLSLAGGWPGGLVGQLVFRHKTRRISFQIVYWLIVFLHACGWCYWIARP